MSIKKYITFEEAERDLWRDGLVRKDLKQVFTIFHLKGFNKLLRCPHGIFKYKTIEEADSDAKRWVT